jgi:drug/metabolite transporter (DMT)-like permease
MGWLFFAASSVFFFTTLNLLQRVVAVDSKYPRALSIVFNLFAALAALVIFWVSGGLDRIQIPKEPMAWVFLAIAVVFYGLFERLRFIAAKSVDASVYATLGSWSVVVAFVIAASLYSEPVTLAKLVGASLIISAMVMTSFKKGVKLTKYGLAINILAQTILGIGWSLDKMGIKYFNLDTYNLLTWTLSLVVIYMPYVKNGEIVRELKVAGWKVMLLAVVNVAGYWLNLKAQELAEATKVIPIVQTSTIFTVLAGIWILKEKDNGLVKIMAGVLAVIGVALLV